MGKAKENSDIHSRLAFYFNFNLHIAQGKFCICCDLCKIPQWKREQESGKQNYSGR